MYINLENNSFISCLHSLVEIYIFYFVYEFLSIFLNIIFTKFDFICNNYYILRIFTVYCIELAIKLSPIPLVVQRKNHEDAKRLYDEILQIIQKNNERFLEITCEKVEDKKISVLVSEIIAVQIYEKTSSAGSSKRPGFSLQT